MVFTNLLGSKAPSRPKPSPASSSGSVRDNPADYIHDDDQLLPVADPPPDLRELNNSLDALTAVFPDIQIEVFREMLSQFQGESRMALAADALLKNRGAWVKGRWRVPGKEAAEPDEDARGVPARDIFRSPGYQQAVKNLAYGEYKSLSRSTINAVLAEHNYAFLDAQPALAELSTKTWRSALTFMFSFRRKKSSTNGEPEKMNTLVLWRQLGPETVVPALKRTGDAELDRELFEHLIRPLQLQRRAAQEESDRTLAERLHTDEAEAANATYECACCFVDATFEEFTSCDTGGHMICHRCVRHTITEAVFGQGWHRSIDKARGTLRCPAVDTSECGGHIVSEHMAKAMAAEKGGDEVLAKLEQRVAEHSLVASNVPLVRCPFCSYAEVDDLYLPDDTRPARLRLDTLLSLAFFLFCLSAIPFLVPLLAAIFSTALLLGSARAVAGTPAAHLAASVQRLRRRRHGPRFSCASPSCGRASCLTCGKAWVDVHVCHESRLVALRTQVEQAMSMAVKRVCPRCHTSFVKTAGCNKLTCPCGYRMCYVCRRDIGTEGYRHFCEHFRPEGDGRSCTQCDRCNLWQAEDTEAVLAAARREAEERWREAENRELSGSERAFLETGVASKRADTWVKRLVSGGEIPSFETVLDSIVERLLAV
jgi:hypothetical protein